MRIGIVAGESSGDQLGAGLMAAIQARIPGAVFEGMGGERMIARGCVSLFPSDTLSIVGFIEVVKHFRELKRIRDGLVGYFLQNPPDVFIGIDVPEFNLGLERRLKRAGIRTVHYVSPQIWAWRRYRVRGMPRTVDLLLTLFPFEAAFYREHAVHVEYVGHPLADELPLVPDRDAARMTLGLPNDKPVVALLPGSRISEVKHLSDVFIETARWCLQRKPELQFVVPLASPLLREMFEQAVQRIEGQLPLTLHDGQSRTAMAASDVVLLASGTATLEALLLKRPMVVTYRVARLNYELARLLVNVDYISLPNLLAGEGLVPELIQDAATADRLGHAVLAYFENPHSVNELTKRFSAIHESLRQDTNRKAAAAVLHLSQCQQ